MSRGRGGVPRVVALGGGHGLAASLRALRRLPVWPVAVVSVADDGGSSGRLRAASDRVAPGDLRKCLVALASDPGPLSQVMEHRFASGDLTGHAFGNLLLAALEESEGDLMAALTVASDLLGVEGEVLPATSQVVDLVGEVTDGSRVAGQVAISATTGLVRVHLEPEPVAPPEVLEAVATADAVVLGPGSLYTSVLAAAVVPGVTDALESLDVPLVYVCNLHPQVHETDCYAVGDHVAALGRHGLVPDSVLYDPTQIGGAEGISGAVPVTLAHSRGLAHDPGLLATALGGLLGL